MEALEYILFPAYEPDSRSLASLLTPAELNKVGKRPGIRQQVLATAQVYLRRFYVKVPVRSTDPWVVMVTALYLASKMEEAPHHIRVIATEAKQAWPDLVLTDTSQIGECEFMLMSELNCELILHHPYRILKDLANEHGLSLDETNFAWALINDSYLTDLPLLQPPFIVAVAAILLTVLLKPAVSLSRPPSTLVHQLPSNPLRSETALSNLSKGTAEAKSAQQHKFMNWLAETELDIEAVVESVREIISLYDALDTYNAEQIRDTISRWNRNNAAAKAS